MAGIYKLDMGTLNKLRVLKEQARAGDGDAWAESYRVIYAAIAPRVHPITLQRVEPVEQGVRFNMDANIYGRIDAAGRSDVRRVQALGDADRDCVVDPGDVPGLGPMACRQLCAEHLCACLAQMCDEHLNCAQGYVAKPTRCLLIERSARHKNETTSDGFLIANA